VYQLREEELGMAETVARRARRSMSAAPNHPRARLPIADAVLGKAALRGAPVGAGHAAAQREFHMNLMRLVRAR
jgi:hypothetical protein